MTVDRRKSSHDAENGAFNKKLPYPKAVFFIVITEFCERFSYYGMRAVLTLFMGTVLHFSDDLATTVYHVFLFLCYFLPLFGGILADSFLGKYNTVLLLSSTFAIGNIILTASSVPYFQLPVAVFSLTGLLFMSIGTGGIKPCVVALGGDQFHSVLQKDQLKQFFSIFFFAVSVGNMFSTVLTPVLRSDVKCFNQDSCYSLAFGVPAILMIVAVVIFASGKRLYKINKPMENIFLKVIQCMRHAVSEKQKAKAKGMKSIEEKKHWVDYADYEGSKFDKKLVQDTKGLLRVLVYYLPIPMFWALYEQLGSRWTLQATHMNGNLGFYTIKPDQMQVANAILMFTFIPIFETILYPLLRKCNIFKRPLQRMGVGGILAALSFVLAGLVQMRIEKNILALPNPHSLEETHLNIINTLRCPVSITTVEGFSSLTNETGAPFEIVAPEDNLVLRSITQRNVNLRIAVTLSDSTKCSLTLPHPPTTFNPSNKSVKLPSNNFLHVSNDSLFLLSSNPISTVPGTLQNVILTFHNGSIQIHLLQTLPDHPLHKSNDETPQLTILNLKDSTAHNQQQSLRIKLLGNNGHVDYFSMNSTGNSSILDGDSNSPSKINVAPGWYTAHLENSDNKNTSQWQWHEFYHSKMIYFENTGKYLLIFKDQGNGEIKDQLVILIPPRIHMLWLLPQYIVMVWAEVLFIISGMEFSFTEAPISMKSVLQSCWHLTNAAGNLMVIISAQIKGKNSSQATEFFIFAALMLCDIIIFCLMTTRYKYVTHVEGDDADDDDSNFNRKIPQKEINDKEDTRL